MTEANTCRKYVVPLLQAAGWDDVSYSICHLAFNAPVFTRHQCAFSLSASNAERVGVRCRISLPQPSTNRSYFTPEAHEILNDLLEKYAADGELQFTLPDVLSLG